MSTISNREKFLLGIGVGFLLAQLPKLLYEYACPHGKKKDPSSSGTGIATSSNFYASQLSANSESAVGSRCWAMLEQEFRLPTHKLHELVKHFCRELEKGLEVPGQTIKALPSYVTKRPTGDENGTVLALDLGGTNLRVCEVVLDGQGKHRMRQKKYVVSEEIKLSDAEKMFDFIATAVDRFLEENKIKGGRRGQKKLPLGFTFSYPVDQTAINVGTLMHWNKGFEVKGVVGQDVCQLLRDALERRKLNIEVVAIVNDTVGTLMSHAYEDPDTYIGVIIGTGSNAAYVERVDRIPKWKTHYGNANIPSGEMIINIEWGAFDNEKRVLPITKFDKRLDEATENVGCQIFEKMISGLYLGELTRLVLVDLIYSGELFHGLNTALLSEPYRFETQFMSRIERDHSGDLSDCQAVLEDLFGIVGSTCKDRQSVKRVCEVIGIRAARLCAAAIAAVVGKMNKLNGCTVAIDGSVFEHYPHFKNRMYDALREIFGLSADNINLALARDGSGVGAALIAAVMAEGK